MKRHSYEMPHFPIVSMKMGRLMTLCQFPVLAGDSVELDAGMVLRLAPLRRELVIDPQVDFFAFWVPHRHVYSNWKEYIEGGVDETETLASYTKSTGSDIEAFGFNYSSSGGASTVPLHAIAPYFQIWNRYFRVPSDRTDSIGFGELADTHQMTLYDDITYGHRCAHLKTLWNTGIVEQLTDADRDAPVSGGTLDITELEQVRARYGSEQARMYFAAAGDRYKDFLRLAFGTGHRTNIDADQRPELLSHAVQFIGGHDIDATSDNIGQYSGKGIADGRFGFPRRFFDEHGSIWIMALARYPLFHAGEAHYLTRTPNPTYKEFVGDPRIVSAEPPADLEPIIQKVLATSSTLDQEERIPFANWLRTFPTARIHYDFPNLEGFPFYSVNKDLAADFKDRHYVDSGDFDQVFQTEQLAHMRLYGKFHWRANRIVPPALSSVFAAAS